MRTKKIKNMEIVPPEAESGAYNTDPMLPKMHTVSVVIGKRNSGKSVAIVNLIEKMGFDYTILVSPTAASNKELMERLNVEHTFDDPDDLSIIDKIKEIVQAEAEDLERYKEELKEYNKLMADLKKGRYLEDDVILKFFGDDSFVKPTHRFNGKKPRIALFCDDCMGSMIYSKPRKLNALSTYSRHLGQLKEGGSIGISLFFAIQSFKCKVGGLTPTIKNQATNILLFKTKDDKELMDVAESCGGEVDKETFIKVYNEAIDNGGDHPFLFIDLHPKKEHLSMFRKKFNEFIIVDELDKNTEKSNDNIIDEAVKS
jgi:hypothetical protein